MAQLFSSPSEVLAIKAICSKDRAISGFVLANTDESYFHNEESQEAYNAILKYMGKKGSTPAFGLLVEELGLSEDTREFLKLSDKAVKSQQQAEQLVESLGEYRRTRLLYKLAKGILNRLQKDAVDVQALSEAVADRVATINSVRSTENSLWHVGKDSNVAELIEEIIYGESTDHVIPTGFKHYDSINGGFKRGSLVLIGGSTGSGKCEHFDAEILLSVISIELEDGTVIELDPHQEVKLEDGESKLAKDLTDADSLDPSSIQAAANKDRNVAD